MKITKIERQKNKTDRYSIYVDGKFSLGINQEVLIEYGLYKNQDINEDIIHKIRQADNNYQVYSKAINYLSYGQKSRKEMYDYLKKQDFKLIDDDLIINETINKLIIQGYLNDLNYAKSYVRTMAVVYYKGPKLIIEELKQRGIQEATIDKAMDEYLHDQEADNIKYLANKYIRSRTSLSQKMIKIKLLQHLIAKGYPKEKIQQFINNYSFSDNRKKEKELLDKDASKLLDKYEKKYESFKLKQRLIQALFSRGYEYDDINSWIEDNSNRFELN